MAAHQGALPRAPHVCHFCFEPGRRSRYGPEQMPRLPLNIPRRNERSGAGGPRPPYRRTGREQLSNSRLYTTTPVVFRSGRQGLLPERDLPGRRQGGPRRLPRQPRPSGWHRARYVDTFPPCAPPCGTTFSGPPRTRPAVRPPPPPHHRGEGLLGRRPLRVHGSGVRSLRCAPGRGAWQPPLVDQLTFGASLRQFHGSAPVDRALRRRRRRTRCARAPRRAKGNLSETHTWSGCSCTRAHAPLPRHPLPAGDLKDVAARFRHECVPEALLAQRVRTRLGHHAVHAVLSPAITHRQAGFFWWRIESRSLRQPVVSQTQPTHARPRISPPQIARPMLLAFSYLHKRGVIHRVRIFSARRYPPRNPHASVCAPASVAARPVAQEAPATDQRHNGHSWIRAALTRILFCCVSRTSSRRMLWSQVTA